MFLRTKFGKVVEEREPNPVSEVRDHIHPPTSEGLHDVWRNRWKLGARNLRVRRWYSTGQTPYGGT
jgi:hypothetical protein